MALQDGQYRVGVFDHSLPLGGGCRPVDCNDAVGGCVRVVKSGMQCYHHTSGGAGFEGGQCRMLSKTRKSGETSTPIQGVSPSVSSDIYG